MKVRGSCMQALSQHLLRCFMLDEETDLNIKRIGVERKSDMKSHAVEGYRRNFRAITWLVKLYAQNVFIDTGAHDLRYKKGKQVDIKLYIWHDTHTGYNGQEICAIRNISTCQKSVVDISQFCL